MGLFDYVFIAGIFLILAVLAFGRSLREPVSWPRHFSVGDWQYASAKRKPTREYPDAYIVTFQEATTNKRKKVWLKHTNHKSFSIVLDDRGKKCVVAYQPPLKAAPAS